MFETPILFLIFNRPEITQRVFDEIKKQKPKFLFIAADGPRAAILTDKEKCKETRAIVMDGIDWDCEVITLFRDENLGCGLAVSSAINWFFDYVEQGIILEDDCLPHPTFFGYCEILLDRYKNDDEIMTISGNNFQAGIKRGDGSYYFSCYAHIWGWATWSRKWASYDYYIKKWPEFREDNFLSYCEGNYDKYSYWKHIFDKTFEGHINTWDYQLLFASWYGNKKNILPNVNLVTNIGFEFGATHTTDCNSKYSKMTIDAYDDIVPSEKKINKIADRYVFYKVYNPRVAESNKMKVKKHVLSIVVNPIKRLFKFFS